MSEDTPDLPERKLLAPEARRALILEVAKLSLPALLAAPFDSGAVNRLINSTGDRKYSYANLVGVSLKLGQTFANTLEENPDVFTARS